jgi:CubicO group peptidase (beta-lactamase class C family)
MLKFRDHHPEMVMAGCPAILSLAQMMAAMRYLESSDDIRSTFQYLNLGYLVASMVTERVSGQSWTEFTRVRLTDKLHMNVTFTVEDLRPSHRCCRALRNGRGHLRGRPRLPLAQLSRRAHCVARRRL